MYITIVPMGAVHNIELLVNVLVYKQGSLPMKYLGLPLGARRRQYGIQFWRRWKGDWRDGNNCTYPREVELL